MSMRRTDNTPRRLSIPVWIVVSSLIGILLGLLGLTWTFLVDPVAAWGWLVVNFVYFVGIVNGSLMWAMVFRATQTRWTAVINRLAHSMIALVPLLGIVLIALLIGSRGYMTWIHHPVPEKEAWLNVPFLVIRNILVVFGFWALSWLLVRWSLKADARVRDGGEITSQEHHHLNVVAVAGVFGYVLTMTIISYDFMMSLWPHWFSTMFAPYYFCTSAYTGLALLVLLAAALRRPLGVERYTDPQQFQDLGNLMLGFALFNLGLFFGQYLTIWYENLPYETDFLIARYLRGTWPILGWSAILVGLAVPFILLQSRYLKRRPRWIAPVAALALLGIALDRYVLVVPSLEFTGILLAAPGLLIGLGFLGVLVLGVALFVGVYPPVSEADRQLAEMIRREAGV